jgi:hypothetical protein
MLHGNLADSIAVSLGLNQELGAEGGTPGDYRDALDDLPLEQLESTIDISRGVAEQQGHQRRPPPPEELAMKRVSAGRSVTHHHVGLAGQRNQSMNVL